MKAIFLAFNQAHKEDINTLFMHLNIKGYTGWETVIGAGTKGGEPHLGSHSWPTLNSAYITMVPDEKVEPVMTALKELDNSSPQLGLRAFSWSVEQTI